MDDQTAELIPFHALNEFMRPDYRLHVVRTALSAAAQMPGDLRSPLEKLVKKHVRVPGFRNSEKAPARVKAQPTAEAFEKSAELVGRILAVWAEAQAELRLQVFEMLADRGWQLLPLESNRNLLPGFFIRWPVSEDFETLHQDFSRRFPGSSASSDDISLMVVWVGMRLPYQTIEDTPENVTEFTGLDLEQDSSEDEPEEPESQ